VLFLRENNFGYDEENNNEQECAFHFIFIQQAAQ
jgi:hypothetical protein